MVVVSCWWAASASAQYGGEVDVNAVVVPVTVRDSKGRVVRGVARNKFHLSVDGFPVPIRDLHLENDLPISLGFILDTSGSMAGRKLEGSRNLVMAFLEERRQEDQLALWTFGNEQVVERFPFGMGWYLLPRMLETIKPWSTTALYDMVRRVPEVMEKADHHRRAAILLTDGVDNDSEISAGEATEIAEGLETPIYVLGVEPPPQTDGGETSYEEILTLIADASGGHYRRIPRAEEMPNAARTLLEELSSRYILTFTTSGVGQRKWRPIEVRVDGLQAVTRTGYVGTLP
ncbi:MAG: VWA domain-containing protein [Candidatus Sulfomarinibacteraceae bacterium]